MSETDNKEVLDRLIERHLLRVLLGGMAVALGGIAGYLIRDGVRGVMDATGFGPIVATAIVLAVPVATYGVGYVVDKLLGEP